MMGSADYLAGIWSGTGREATWFTGEIARYRSGWGMYYYVAAVYTLTGRNPFALQLLSGILGANTCVLIYRIARMIYPSQRLARQAGILTAIAAIPPDMDLTGFERATYLFSAQRLSYLHDEIERTGNGQRMSPGCCYLSLGFMHCGITFSLSYLLRLPERLLFAAKKFSPKQILQGSGAVLLIGLMFAYYGAGGVAQRSMNLSQMQANREWSARCIGFWIWR